MKPTHSLQAHFGGTHPHATPTSSLSITSVLYCTTHTPSSPYPLPPRKKVPDIQDAYVISEKAGGGGVYAGYITLPA